MKVTAKSLAGIFIVAILVLSLFGFVLSYKTNDTSVLEYNGIPFRQIQSGWRADIAGKQRMFAFHPLELQGLFVDADTATLLRARTLAISYDDNASDVELLGGAQYYMERAWNDQRTIVRGVSGTTSTLPHIGCESATGEQPVIMLLIANTTTMKTMDKCIIVQAQDGAQFIRYADLMSYQILGVFNGQ